MRPQPLNSPVLCRRTQYSTITIRGDRVDDYLQGQLTQDMAKLSADRLLYAALLTPQGKAVCDGWLSMDGERRLLIVPSFALDVACARLRRFSLGYTLTIEADSACQLWSLQGAGSCQLAQPYSLCWPMAEADDDGCWLLAHTQPDIAASLVDEPVMEAARVVYGTPRFGVDWSDYPLNANLIERGGVSFEKGCFVGQEVTSRMKWRGGIRKTLCHLHLQQLPATLPIAICSSVAVGSLTSAACDADGVVYGIGQLPLDIVASEPKLSLDDGTAIEWLRNDGF